MKSGEKDDAYKKMLGIECANSSDTISDTSSSSSESKEELQETKTKFVNSRRPKDETPESRNLRKKAVKEQQAEKRKTKIKKHIKKRKEKMSKK